MLLYEIIFNLVNGKNDTILHISDCKLSNVELYIIASDKKNYVELVNNCKVVSYDYKLILG